MPNIPATVSSETVHTNTMLKVELTDKSRCGYFTVNSDLSVEQGNQVAYQFSKNNPLVKAIYFNGKFWILRHPTHKSNQKQWQEQLDRIATEIGSKTGALNLSIKEIKKVSNPPEKIIAKLAASIIRKKASQESWQKIIYKDKHITIYCHPKIVTETFSEQAAIGLNWQTSKKYPGTLKDYWLKTQRNNDLLLGLDVKNRFIPGSRGIIHSIIGLCQTEKARLLTYPDLNPNTQKIIENSENTDLVVAIKSKRWGKETFPHYVVEGLEISINEYNAHRLGINYEFYREKTKIKLDEWLDLLIQVHKKIISVLGEWGINVSKKYLNSQDYPQNFYIAQYGQQNLKLRFGSNFVSSRNAIKNGLSKGGVYRRHSDFKDLSIPIQIIVLNLCKTQENNFVNRLKAELELLKFKVSFLEKRPLKIDGNMSENDAVLIEKEIQRIAALEPNLVLTILPKGDKKLDNTEQGSYYYHLSNLLLPRGIGSQMVSEENVNNSYIFNNIVLGILAKLGNLPFIFAEPLKVADYFIGLDVARERKSKASGTSNACACVRIYGATGEFIKYKLADSLIEGEEIPVKVLRNLLPFEDLSGKTVLIFRDGRFRGKEIDFLQERAKAIDAKFIFVEITKTGTCRLFNLDKINNQIKLKIPTQYLVFKHSETEATVTTTNPPISVGLTQPIRVTILEAGIVPPLDDVLEATIKLCSLHHGSYKEAGIPIPIFASDRIGYKTLKGLYHVQKEGEKQWWL